MDDGGAASEPGPAGESAALSYLGRSRNAARSEPVQYADPDWWSGFYIGGTGGYGGASTRVDGDAGRFSHEQSGATVGMIAGYNWSAQNFVFGLEGDVKAAWVSGSSLVAAADLSQNMRWMGTARARAGVLLAPALLVYGLAGLSAADFQLQGAVAGGGSSDRVLLGLQVGGGAEVKLTEQWSLRAEYTYTNFGREQIGPSGFSNSFDPSAHAVQAGIVYRF